MSNEIGIERTIATTEDTSLLDGFHGLVREFLVELECSSDYYYLRVHRNAYRCGGYEEIDSQR